MFFVRVGECLKWRVPTIPFPPLLSWLLDLVSWRGRATGVPLPMSSSLINFSSLEEVLNTVSEQQRAIFDTLEGMRAEVDGLALRTSLENQERVLADGCAASPGDPAPT